MAGAGAALATELVKPKSLDLKWSLTLRVVAVALACFLAAAALVVYGTYHELRHAQENVADAVVKLLQVQLFRIETNSDLPSRFPEWEPLTDRVQAAGQCVQYIKPDGTVGRSSCMARQSSLPSLWVIFPTVTSMAPSWTQTCCATEESRAPDS